MISLQAKSNSMLVFEKRIYLWSIDTNEKSNLCFDLNITSLWGISKSEGGPKGVQRQNNASGASSAFLFCPCRTLIFPLMSNLWKRGYWNILVSDDSIA